MIVECFFFIENETENDLEGVIQVLCIECRQKLPREFPAWFYSGKVGEWNLECKKCGGLIYECDIQDSGGEILP